MQFVRRVAKLLARLLFVSACIPIAMATWNFWRRNDVPKNTILRLVLDGSIEETPPARLTHFLGSPSDASLHQLAQGIRRAATDPRIIGLLLDVRQPQVGVAQLAELSRAMDVFRDSDKWNASFLETAGEGLPGDGAYALATLADDVILAPPGDIHLGGLRTDVNFVRGALEKAKVRAYVEKRYEYKNYANMFTESAFTPEHRESLVSVLNDVQQTLLELIATNRDVEVDEVKKWVMASPMVSQAAKDARLVDRVAYWDEVLAEAKHVAGNDDPFYDADAYAKLPRHHKKPVHVALIAASGEIVRGEPAGGVPGRPRSGISSNVYAQAFRDAREDNVRAVVLRVDSPGGSAIASDLIRREVELTRRANIPVVVSMGNTAASGGYFISADADWIVAEPSTITGSIGVLSVSFHLREALSHFLGVTFDSYQAIPHPGLIGFLDYPSVEDRKRVGENVDAIYHDFVAKVASGRHRSYEDIQAVARGRIWSGKQAKAHGLVDALGGFDVVEDYLREHLALRDEEELAYRSYPEAPGPLGMVRDLLDVEGRTLGQALATARELSETWMRAQGRETQMRGSVAPRLP